MFLLDWIVPFLGVLWWVILVEYFWWSPSFHSRGRPWCRGVRATWADQSCSMSKTCPFFAEVLLAFESVTRECWLATSWHQTDNTARHSTCLYMKCIGITCSSFPKPNGSLETCSEFQEKKSNHKPFEKFHSEFYFLFIPVQGRFCFDDTHFGNLRCRFFFLERHLICSFGE